MNKDPVIETIAERLTLRGYVSLAHDLRSVWPRVNSAPLVGMKSAPTEVTEWSAAENGEGPGLIPLIFMGLQTLMFILVVYIAFHVH